ncbi:MAG: hemerythrin domain-containing protein [Paludibacteraceae bacterium]|nr:hemerythrin domain-containing protein [Paludibacteraceae bacterium]
MADIIHIDLYNLFIINRFGIHLGFGDKTIEEVCKNENVDPRLFVTVCNINNSTKSIDKTDIHTEHILQLVNFLKNSHDYYRKIRLPEVKRSIFNLSKFYDANTEKALGHFFDEYIREFKNHIEYEENTVFPYIKGLCDGVRNDDFSINKFEDHHDNIEEKLGDLKNIIIKYMSKPEHDLHKLDLLDKLFQLQDDLNRHTMIEDLLLTPMVSKLETL